MARVGGARHIGGPEHPTWGAGIPGPAHSRSLEAQTAAGGSGLARFLGFPPWIPHPNSRSPNPTLRNHVASCCRGRRCGCPGDRGSRTQRSELSSRSMVALLSGEGGGTEPILAKLCLRVGANSQWTPKVRCWGQGSGQTRLPHKAPGQPGHRPAFRLGWETWGALCRREGGLDSHPILPSPSGPRPRLWLGV